MWTLSGFADEIDPDLETQCSTLDELGITHIELRSAWDTNVLDLSDEQVEEVATILAAHGIETLRVPALDVMRNLEGVVVHILATVRARLPLHHRPKGTGGPPPRDKLGED